MKKLFPFLLSLTFTLLFISGDSLAKPVDRDIYKELVLGEIQNTFVEDYKVDKNFFAPIIKKNKGPKKGPISFVTPIPTPTPSRVVSPTPTPTVKKETKRNNIVQKKKRRKKRGLLDWFSDDEDEEESDLLGKKKGKRKKKGLIEDDVFEPEPFKFDGKKAKRGKLKGVIEPSRKEGPQGDDWASQKMREMDQWSNQKKSEQDQWFKEKQEILNNWAKAKKVFQKNLPAYKKNLVNYARFESTGSPNQYKNDSSLKVKAFGSRYHVIPEGFFSDVKDQGKRPTCAAFAATRALEITLAQTGTKETLSEQYFYYASKPECQQSPCAKRGSWPLNAFNRSMSSSTPDIPLEKDCPYSKFSKYGNETQVPLRNGCFQGRHKLDRFYKVKNLNDIKNALGKGNPVVAAFKLSPNFYKNKGVVLSRGSQGVASGKAHAAGHAVLLIGYMKIPDKLGEGKLCFLTANSWGSGWGKGGHACLSEKWVNQYRFPISFLAVDSVQ